VCNPVPVEVVEAEQFDTAVAVALALVENSVVVAPAVLVVVFAAGGFVVVMSVA